MVQPILPTVFARSVLLLTQRFDMGGRFYLRTAIKASSVRGDLIESVEHANDLQARQYDECAPYVHVRHGVVVAVEAYVGRLANAHLTAFLARPRITRQCDQPLALLVEGLAHRNGSVFWTRPVGSDTVTPALRLIVQIIQIGERDTGKEA